MNPALESNESYLLEMRLFLEEICCNLCRFQHVRKDGLLPEQIQINQEVALGKPGTFADIRVEAPGYPPYFVEIKYGYPEETIVSHLARKYGPDSPGASQAGKVVVVVSQQTFSSWPKIQSALLPSLRPNLALEVWDESQLLSRIQECFDFRMEAITEQKIEQLRAAIDRAKGLYAFGDQWTNDGLQQSLLWHLGFWRLRQLRDEKGLDPIAILAPAKYLGVVVLLADLSDFSSYVRDTPDDQIVRHCLSSFYFRARYQILNTGGMMDQFVGDEVIGFFGLPHRRKGYLQDALQCAKALLDIGDSVSHDWQRHIDRVQQAGGVHIGMAMGDVQIVPQRPFGRARLSAISDSLNVAARLRAEAGPGQIVVSNTYYQRLDESSQAEFQSLGAVEARNLGRIKAWNWNRT